MLKILLKISVCVCACVLSCFSCVRLVTLWTVGLLSPWDSPGKNTRVSCHALLQGIFQNQESNLSLLHCRWFLNGLSHQESPLKPSRIWKIMIWSQFLRMTWIWMLLYLKTLCTKYKFRRSLIWGSHI